MKPISSHFGRPVGQLAGDDEPINLDIDSAALAQPDDAPEHEDQSWMTMDSRESGADEANPLLAHLGQILAAAQALAARPHWRRPLRITIVAPPREIPPTDIVTVALKAGWACDLPDAVDHAAPANAPRLLLVSSEHLRQSATSSPAQDHLAVLFLVTRQDEIPADARDCLLLDWTSPSCRRLLVDNLWLRRARLLDDDLRLGPLPEEVVDHLASLPLAHLPPALDLLMGDCLVRAASVADPILLGAEWAAADPIEQPLPSSPLSLADAILSALRERAVDHDIQVNSVGNCSFFAMLPVGTMRWAAKVEIRLPQPPTDLDTFYIRAVLVLPARQEQASKFVSIANVMHASEPLGAVSVMRDGGGLKLLWQMPFSPQPGARGLALQHLADQVWVALQRLADVFSDQIGE